LQPGRVKPGFLNKKKESMKLTKKLIVLAIGMVALLLSACTAQVTGGFPSGTVANQDTLYVSSGSAVLAVKPDGSEIWRYPEKIDANKSFFAAPAAIEGLVVVGDYQNSLFGLDAANGKEKWVFADAKGRYVASPVVAGNKIIAANADGSLYALDQAGKPLWKFSAKGGLWGTPAVDKDHVYIPSQDHFLYSINIADGTQAWATDLGGPMIGAPYLSKEGVLYVGTLGDKVYAVDAASGNPIWNYATQGHVWASPAVNNNMVYVGDAASKIYALKAKEGSLAWQTDAPGPVIASPGVMTSGLAFVSETGDVLVVGFQNEKSWTDKINGKLYSSPIVYGDRLVVPVYQGDNFLVTYDFTGRKGWTLAVPK
jgi:outer membrane protein assembly factor BamB